MTPNSSSSSARSWIDSSIPAILQRSTRVITCLSAPPPKYNGIRPHRITMAAFSLFSLSRYSERQEQGGHDSKFVCEVSDRFICQICAKVLREPHLAVCCGQHFCESCLNRWFNKQHGKETCPHCRAEGKEFSHVINKGLRSEIYQLEVKCSNHGKGCKWTGELGTLKTHLQSGKGCGFVEVDCPNRCRDSSISSTVKLIQRKDLDKHLKTECNLRPYKCEHCGHKDTYHNITGKGHPPARYTHIKWFSLRTNNTSHYDKCLDFPLTCLNKCGTENIKRRNMKHHRSECPQEPVQCPFAEAGCKEGLRRRQLEGHMTSSVQHHLLLVMNDHKRLKERLRETEAKLEKLTTNTKMKK